MNVTDPPMTARRAFKAGLALLALVGGPLGLCVGVYAMQAADGFAPATAPNAAAAPVNPWLPHGDGTRDPRNPMWSTDPSDPYPMPPEFANIDLSKQTAAQAHAKSEGCLVCHQGARDPHFKETVKLGCTDCHGGDPCAVTKESAHVAARYPQFWPAGGANPVRSYSLLNHESPEFIRFVNPGDFRVAHIGCGTANCHPKEVQTNRKQMMTTGCMLWGAALYNNGAVPNKRAKYGEAYGMAGAPLRIKTTPPPTEEEKVKKGVVEYLEPLPRFENSQPSNILRIFEPGGRFQAAETGIPEKIEEPGRPRARLSVRGMGTANRTDPVFVSLTKTRLFNPSLSMLGTNDNPGDFRSSGCSACHVIYANDRSRIHSGPYAEYGNRGLTSPANPDPTIPKDQPGHPVAHRFTSSIPVSQCMVCHTHPGTTVMNSYIGYMWYDEDTEADKMYPAKQKTITPGEWVQGINRNPNEIDLRNNLSDPEFLANLTDLNSQMSLQQFADFHNHGWAYRAVFKKDLKGNLLDFHGKFVGPPNPQMLMASVDFPNKVRQFHQNNRFDSPAEAVAAERKQVDSCRAGLPVHLMDIHMEKGMHCVDCHFSQDAHGNNRIQMETRAATEIACIDCHGTPATYSTLVTSGPASYTSSPDGSGRNLAALKTPFGVPRFEVQEGADGKRRYFQNSMVEKGLRWEVVQTRDTIDRTHPRYNAKSALAKTVRVEDGKTVWGELPDDPAKCAHTNSNMTCIACHSSWNPSCYGCHLPQKANLKMPFLVADGDVTRNYTAYNWQTLRDDVYMLARDGTATGNKINPSRSSCAIHVGSQNGNREGIYVQQQTVSAEGFSGIAFSTNAPHTVRGKGVRETKQCTDCHLSQKNDNNALMAQLLMHGTQYLNWIGKYCYVAAGEEGFFSVVVTESPEPQTVIGSDLHRFAYPDDFQKHLDRKGYLEYAREHPGRDISQGLGKPFKKTEVLQVQNRGEYMYAACGEDGVRVFDIAFVDHKGFAEPITTAPVSPVGQKFYLKTKNARYVNAPITTAVDPTRKQDPVNQEQKPSLLFGFLYICDKEEGVILAGAATTIDGNPVNNFLKREVTFNPDGILCGARFITFVGNYGYVCADAGLVVVDFTDPTKPKVVTVLGEKEHVEKPRAIQVQFRYAYVADEEGIKTLDVTDPTKPVVKSVVKLKEVENLYVARTYLYAAAKKKGLVIFDVTNAEEPKLDQIFDAGGCINDAHDVKLGITYNSEFAYIADGKNGLRVVQLTSPHTTPGFEGFSPRPTPKLVATYKPKLEAEFLSVAKGVDRDRAVDESGNQIGVFGRVGARPLNQAEQQKMYLRDGKPWFVSDDPYDPLYMEVRKRRAGQP